MVEMFKVNTEKINNNQYSEMKKKLCMKKYTYKRNIKFVREAYFESAITDKMNESFSILMNRNNAEKLYLVKKFYSSGCMTKNTENISKKDFQMIVDNNTSYMKESENELLKELGWYMEINEYKLTGIREFVVESYTNSYSDEELSFDSLALNIAEAPMYFLREQLTPAEEIDYGSILFTYKKKLSIPFTMYENASTK